MPVPRVDWVCPSCSKKYAVRADVPTPKLCPVCRQAAKAARAANPEAAAKKVRRPKPGSKPDLVAGRPESAVESETQPAALPPFLVPPSVAAAEPSLPAFLAGQAQAEPPPPPLSVEADDDDSEMEFTPFVGERDEPVPPAPGMPLIPTVSFDQLAAATATPAVPPLPDFIDDAGPAARLLGRRFPALRVIALIYKGFAALALVAALWMIGAGVMVVFTMEASPERSVAIIVDLAAFGGCLVGAVCLFAAGELIELLLAIEDHTRVLRAGG